MGVIRKTKSVKTLLSVFEQTDGAISVVDLVKRLDKQMNKTTVYRVLERLKEDGQLHSFIGKDGVRWYAKCHQCSSEYHQDLHPHFQCKDCGKTACLSFEITIPNIPNYKIDSADILLVGQCEHCSP